MALIVCIPKNYRHLVCSLLYKGRRLDLPAVLCARVPPRTQRLVTGPANCIFHQSESCLPAKYKVENKIGWTSDQPLFARRNAGAQNGWSLVQPIVFSTNQKVACLPSTKYTCDGCYVTDKRRVPVIHASRSLGGGC